MGRWVAISTQVQLEATPGTDKLPPALVGCEHCSTLQEVRALVGSGSEALRGSVDASEAEDATSRKAAAAACARGP